MVLYSKYVYSNQIKKIRYSKFKYFWTRICDMAHKIKTSININLHFLRTKRLRKTKNSVFNTKCTLTKKCKHHTKIYMVITLKDNLV